MRKTIFVSCLLLFAFAFTSRAVAQDEPKPVDAAKAAEPVHYYHLELVVQELGTDGKPTNSRTYTTTVSTDNRGSASIRTGSKIPFVTGSTSSLENNVQYQYQDVGVKIDAQRAHEIGHQLSLDLSADITNVADSSDSRLHLPVLRQNKWQAVVLILVGKPTVVFTSDALDSKGSMQLAVTATPVQ
ncbi:MAG TPA: hypothetical protein VGI45_12995 [Terracidiphilus sp.]|jgi:hypothetical protein